MTMAYSPSREPAPIRAALHHRRWPRLPLALTLALTLTLLLARSASAAPDPRADQAARLVAEGGELYYRREYAAALERFERAEGLYPTARTIFNVAQCQRKLGRPAAALRAYQIYLSREPDAPNRKRVEATIAELRAEVAAIPPPSPPVTPSPPPSTAPPILPGSERVVVAPAPVAAPSTAAGQVPPTRWYRRWYVWTLVAVVVAGGAAAGAVLGTRSSPGLPPTPPGYSSGGVMGLFGARP
jgi:tetratricopeptide (TPR) repeat protein